MGRWDKLGGRGGESGDGGRGTGDGGRGTGDGGRLGFLFEQEGYLYFVTSLIIRKIYILPKYKKRGDVVMNVSAIEKEREKCESFVF